MLAEDLQQLLVLQGVDSRLDRARSTQASLDTGSALAAAYNTGKAAFDKLREAAVHAQGEQRDAELRLQAIETKTTSETQKMYGNAALSARELGNLQKELEMLGHQKGDAEDKVLAAMESASAAMAHAQKAERELLAYADQYKKVRATYKERHAELATEIAEIEKERATAAAPVPPALLARYDSIRSKRAGVGAALLTDDNSCSGCHTQNSSGTAGEVRALRSVQTCENCGRILVPDAS